MNDAVRELRSAVTVPIVGGDTWERSRVDPTRHQEGDSPLPSRSRIAHDEAGERFRLLARRSEIHPEAEPHPLTAVAFVAKPERFALPAFDRHWHIQRVRVHVVHISFKCMNDAIGALA